MSEFIRVYKDYEIRASVSASGPTEFSCEQLKDKENYRKRFSTEKEIEAALDRFDLTQRKNFANREAIYMSEYNAPSVVEVLTLTTNDEAWIKKGDRREKVRLDQLYVDLGACELFLAEKETIEQVAQQKVDRLRAKLKRWEPEKETP